ncbi:unnamed protein product [Lymnaea stagnalis]|uniref:STI1/HOP DP domain-containing protein n=1 Tax=Lymnaea stagnalis TaxID=6523 RepID=A0AAV2HTD8_LYMST
MADDSDVPPLEDMTQVLKKVETLREGILSQSNVAKSQPASAKERAKVRKNTSARVVQPERSGNTNEGKVQMDSFSKNPTEVTKQNNTGDASEILVPETKSTIPPKTSNSGMFGGLKKGFLFGGSSKEPSAASTSVKSSAPKAVQPPKAVPPPTVEKAQTDIPFISPSTGKTSSGLTLDEVQMAMSETKGLLDNQDWINDDLLGRVENNEFLLKRFADPHFMKALQEFQTSPQAAMEKYKSNKEVEKFLLDFCALLGDHFTTLGSPTADSAGSQNLNATQPPGSSPSVSTTQSVKPQPKIIEISGNSSATEENKKIPKIVELPDSDLEKCREKSTKAEGKKIKQEGGDRNSPKKVKKKASGISKPDTSILSTEKEILDLGPRPGDKSDIKEITPVDDAQVKELLEDPKVMATLLDPKIMNLIQTLKTDPDKAHSLVEKADANFRDKISFLVGKRLLHFQTY